MDKGEGSSSSAATVVAGASVAAADHKKDNGSSILTKDQRIEKVVSDSCHCLNKIRHESPTK
jgi:hypothetical protein